MTTQPPNHAPALHYPPQGELTAEARSRSAHEAAIHLAQYPPEIIAPALVGLNPAAVLDILKALPADLSDAVTDAVSPEFAAQWRLNRTYPKESVGQLMAPVYAVFKAEMTVAQTIERLRALVKIALISYCYITDERGRLCGLVTMRDLLFARPEQRLQDIMLPRVFQLRPETPLNEAMKLVVDRHYPEYPVCDADGLLLGLVRGQTMFEEQAIEITAQVGTAFGVQREERLTTPIVQSFKFRHPWLQLALLTAFAAGGVVAFFQHTVDRLVILALFLPVIAGQSGNTGCQALGVTLRGMTLGELKSGRDLIFKEAWLGFYNGSLTGLVAALSMLGVALYQENPNALALATVVWTALVGACVISGVCGAVIPLTLKRLGLDPATASSIFLNTTTDVVSMGMLLGLATLLIR